MINATRIVNNCVPTISYLCSAAHAGRTRKSIAPSEKSELSLYEEQSGMCRVLSSVGLVGHLLFSLLALIGLSSGLIEGKSHHNNYWLPHDDGAPTSQSRQHGQASWLLPRDRDEICKFPSKAQFSECRPAQPAWFYHKSIRECTYLPDGDCASDHLARGFESKDECKSTCYPKDELEEEEEEDEETFYATEPEPEAERTSCELPDSPTRPACLLPLPVWFYNKSESKCIEYSEGVCPPPPLGYDATRIATNQGFSSEMECEFACRHQALKPTETRTRTKERSKTNTTLSSATTTTRLPIIQQTTPAVVTTKPSQPPASKTTTKRPSDLWPQSTTTSCTTLKPSTRKPAPSGGGDESETCNLPIEVGPCRALIPAWYYNHALGQCRRFTYSGCGGNANNFRSREECAQTCPAVRARPL